MKGRIETWWRGPAYFEDMRQRAIARLGEVLPQRDAGWQYAPEELGPYTLLFQLTQPPYAIAVHSGAWRSSRQRMIESNYAAFAGRDGYLVLALYAEDVLENADAALDRVFAHDGC